MEVIAKINKRYLALLILIALLSVALYLIDKQLLARVFFISWVVCLTYYLLKLFKHYFEFVLRYLFDKPFNHFEKKIVGPRIAFYLLGTVLIFFVLYVYTHSMIEVQAFGYNIGWLNYVVFNLIATFGLIYFHFSWQADLNKKNGPDTDNFIVAEVSNQNPKLLRKEEGTRAFDLKVEDDIFFEKLYENLYDFDFLINNSAQDCERFKEILSKGKIPEKPLFELKMDNVQAGLFYDLLPEGDKKLTKKNFIKIFKNENGLIKYNSFTSSISRNNSGPRREKEIRNCFEITTPKKRC